MSSHQADGLCSAANGGEMNNDQQCHKPLDTQTSEVLEPAEAGNDRRRSKKSSICAKPANNDAKQLRPRTAEDIANEQTAEQLALRIWAAMVAQKVLSGMSALMDELIQSHLLDDDDEEADERAGSMITTSARKNILDEAISDGLDKYPDFDAINNLPSNSDPDIARDAEQLKKS